MTATVAPDDLVARIVRACPGVEIDGGTGTRARYGFDASNYRIVPMAVAFPRTVHEVRAIVRACADAKVAITSRGAGTSMAGNAVGQGLVLDLSRHLHRIDPVDPDRRTVRVEAGAVLDDVNAAVVGHGHVAPDPSSHSRATIGGMIGNDACGNHSVRWGRTSQHVESIEVVLDDGSHLLLGRDLVRAVDPHDDASRRRAERLTDELRRLAGNHLAVLRTELGRIERQVSGYHLDELLPEKGFDVARALVGSEGTCAVVVAATLHLVDRPTATDLVVIGYDDIVAAAADVPMILPHDPTAVEGIDEAIVRTMIARRGPDSVAGLPKGRAWLYVELDGPDPDSVRASLARLVAQLHAAGRMVDATTVASPVERAALWQVRENGAGLLTRPDPTTQTWAGWEDAAVAPERLAGYLRDFRALLDRHGLLGVLYGHFGAGCVHVRIDFDLATSAGIERMRRFLHEAARLVVEHGGSLSGEHGDGRARSELLPIMYSPAVMELFGLFKRIFDPSGLFNPGVIVDPAPVHDSLVPLGPSRLDAQSAFTYPEDTGFAAATRRCVGIARCRSDNGGFMCPSYRATHEEKDSTRGRARVLQEMVTGELVTDGWRSAEALEALDLCLSCKACSADCPVGVDMATYKSEFLSHHYRGRLRPRSHYTLGWLPRWLRIASRVPTVANGLLAWGPLRRAAQWIGGVTTRRELPRFAGGRASQLADDPDPDVLLFVDSFTRGFRPGLAQASAGVLRDAGLRVAAAPQACCGLTWITTGQLGGAQRILSRAAAALDTTGDVPLVVLEPSCAAALKEDLPRLVDDPAAARVAARVRLFSQVIEDRSRAGWRPPPLPPEVTVQTHCHQYAVFGSRSGTRWLQSAGVRVDAIEGCCGLAGNFGFEADHYETSMAVADQALVPALTRRSSEAPVITDGFSCHTQVGHVSAGQVAPRHLAELLWESIQDEPRRADRPRRRPSDT